MSEAQELNPFGVRGAIVLILASALLAGAYLFLSGFGNDINRSFTKPPGPLSTRATGFKGIYQLIEASGGTPILARSPDDLGTRGLLVLTPTEKTRSEDIQDILDDREDLPTLIVLPKWVTVTPANKGGREFRFEPMPPKMIAHVLPLKDVEIQQGQTRRGTLPLNLGFRPFHTPRELQTISAPYLRPLIQASNGGAVLAHLRGSGRTWILADPDLLNNHGIRDPGDALGALSLLAALNPDQPGEVDFDLTLHYRPGDRNLIRLMLTPPFVAVTIALLAAAILAGIASAARFGPVRREGRALALGKAALIDNIAALTRLAGRTPFGGGAYADAIRDWAARRLRAPRGLSGEALDAWLDAHGRGRCFSELSEQAHRASSEAEMLRAARDLDEWRKELTA